MVLDLFAGTVDNVSDLVGDYELQVLISRHNAYWPVFYTHERVMDEGHSGTG